MRGKEGRYKRGKEERQRRGREKGGGGRKRIQLSSPLLKCFFQHYLGVRVANVVHLKTICLVALHSRSPFMEISFL